MAWGEAPRTIREGATLNWYLGVWKKYATFSGRARRTEYWMFFLFNLIISIALGFTDGILGMADRNGNGPLGGLYSLAVLIPSIAVGVRRMHDSDHSGWWLLLPIVNLIFALTDGTPGPNRFGPDPKVDVAPMITAPAGWLPDPTSRHQYRYWDSVRWTSAVSDNGLQYEDPL